MSPAPSIDYLVAWAAELNARRGRGPAVKTVKGHHDALRSFWAFVIRRDYATRKPHAEDRHARVRPAPERLPAAPEDSAMLEAVESPEERILVYLVRFAGLRSEEARASLNREVDTSSTSGRP